MLSNAFFFLTGVDNVTTSVYRSRRVLCALSKLALSKTSACFLQVPAQWDWNPSGAIASVF